VSETLSDINHFLFQQLQALSSGDLTDEELELQLKRTDGVVKVADKLIQNGELAFKVMQHMDSYGYAVGQLPPMLTYSTEEVDE